MVPPIWKNNLFELTKAHPQGPRIMILIDSLLNYFLIQNWRGACHESCGVMYIILNEMGVPCSWRLGEVEHRKGLNGGRVIFDHSWIEINRQVVDLAICKTLQPNFDSSPVVFNLDLETMESPSVIYRSELHWEDNEILKRVKTIPLSQYLSGSPVHPKLGTWYLILGIAQKLDLNLDVKALVTKYNGIFWE